MLLFFAISLIISFDSLAVNFKSFKFKVSILYYMMTKSLEEQFKSDA